MTSNMADAAQGGATGSGSGGTSASGGTPQADAAMDANAGSSSDSGNATGTAGTDGSSNGGASTGGGGNATGGSGAKGGSSGTSGSGGTCSDGGPITVSCDAIDSEACPDNLGVQREQCDEAATFLKPRLVNLARSCMLALSDNEICGPANVTECIKGALVQSCPDSSSDAICQDLASQCGGPLDDCDAIIGGLTSAGRDDLLDCVPDFCDFDDCLQGLGLL